MEATITIYLPVPPELFALFLGILGIALIYYVTKFVITALIGG
jgi:hypothetical protein